MASLFAVEGVLSAVVGEGYLSAFELGTLSPGDMVRTTRQAGYPGMLTFNGLPFAPCEVVVLGGSQGMAFGVRVVSADCPQPADLGPAARDDLVELLPFAVSLGTITVSLADLRGVGSNTLINMGRRFSAEEDAELLVAGIPAAAGKVIVIEEEMGIRLTRVFGDRFEEPNIRTSGFLLAGGDARRIKDYDFRRPDKFSRSAILKLTEIHRFFLRNLAARHPVSAQGLALPAGCDGVDQCTFSEAQAIVARDRTTRLFLAENSLRRGGAHRDSEGARSTAAGKTLLETPGVAVPVSKEAHAWFAQHAGAQTGLPRSLVFLYCRDGGPLAETVESEPDSVLACLRGGWRHLIDLNLRAVPGSDPLVKTRQPIDENEMVILVRAMDAEGRVALSVVYPYFTLEPMIGLLD